MGKDSDPKERDEAYRRAQERADAALTKAAIEEARRIAQKQANRKNEIHI